MLGLDLERVTRQVNGWAQRRVIALGGDSLRLRKESRRREVEDQGRNQEEIIQSNGT